MLEIPWSRLFGVVEIYFDGHSVCILGGAANMAELTESEALLVHDLGCMSAIHPPYPTPRCPSLRFISAEPEDNCFRLKGGVISEGSKAVPYGQQPTLVGARGVRLDFLVQVMLGLTRFGEDFEARFNPPQSSHLDTWIHTNGHCVGPAMVSKKRAYELMKEVPANVTDAHVIGHLHGEWRDIAELAAGASSIASAPPMLALSRSG